MGRFQHGGHLSKAYMKKLKYRKVQESTDSPENARPRIIVRNISFKATEDDIKNLYQPFGPIDEVNVLRDSNGKMKGCAFIEFKNESDASKAIFKTNKADFLGRPISCAWAISKDRYLQKLEEVKDESQGEEKAECSRASESVVDLEACEKSQIPEEKKWLKKTKMTAEERKINKEKKRKKRARIIIRNLPFKASEKSIEEFFSQYGGVEQVEILKNSNGKLTGCGFVQFENVQSAAKAVHYANMRSFFERKIVVDWALPKNTYTEIKKEPESKEEPQDDVQAKVEVVEDAENKVEEKNKKETYQVEHDEEESNDEVSESDQDQDEDEEEEDGGEKDAEDDKEKTWSEIQSRKPRNTSSSDIQEGKTVFLKNVPFRAKKEDLQQCMEQFGPVVYAVICMDPMTEHSRGTAFVKFQNIEDAEKCLQSGTELELLNQVLDPHKALPRGQASSTTTKQEEKSKSKDSRNLYLIREGVVLAGTAAAKGVSAPDMAKRLQLEQTKSQMLRNLNMFISKERLVIHNLPPSYDNAKLRTLFFNHSPRGAVITEANVMRDLKNVDGKGIGLSKGHGFVTFSNHEDALKALRAINNNPKIFTATQRPIVAFSIENRVMVNAKMKRIAKSRENNPLCAEFKKAEPEPPMKRRKVAQQQQQQQQQQQEENEEQQFSGVRSKFGPVKLRSKFNIKKQASVHAEAVKKDKKKAKAIRQEKALRQQKIDSRKEGGQSMKKRKREDTTGDQQLMSHINDYKSRLSEAIKNKSKWYETS